MAWLQRETAKKRAASAGPLSTPTEGPRGQIAADLTPPPQPHVKRTRREKRAQRKRFTARTFHNGSVLHDLMRDAVVDLRSSNLAPTSNPPHVLSLLFGQRGYSITDRGFDVSNSFPIRRFQHVFVCNRCSASHGSFLLSHGCALPEVHIDIVVCCCHRMPIGIQEGDSICYACTR